LAGCGSGGDEGVGGADVSSFQGLWAAQHSSGTDTCFGDFDSAMIQFTMRLRAGKTVALEYVSLDQQDLTHETCVQGFSVQGSEATMAAAQSCYYAAGQDPATGEAIMQEVKYTADHLKVSGDSLEETGTSETKGPQGTCAATFHLVFERL
jgi:hypothetical protein